MPLFVPQAHDHRGQPVEYIDPMYHGSQLTPQQRERLYRGKRRLPRWFVPAALVVLGLNMLLTYTTLGPPAFLRNLVYSIGFGMIGWWFVMPTLRQWAWRWRWKYQYLSIGHCPACQYDLAGLDAEGDGCTICPECNAAWRLEASGGDAR